MGFLKEAKKLVEVIYSDEHNVETVDKSLAPYIKMPIQDIINDIVGTQKTPVGRLGETVLYPGCATDIVRCLLVTGAKKFIGLDLVDTLFYPGLDESVRVNDHTKQVTELVHIITEMTNNIKLVDGDNGEKIFDYLNISGNKLVADFTLAGIKRHVVVYVGVDANKFIPPEAKNIDTVFFSAMLPSAEFFAHYKPKYYVSDLIKEDFDAAAAGGHLKGKITLRFWRNGFGDDANNNFALYHILNITDTNNPLILAKAELLKEYFSKIDYEVWSMKSTRRNKGKRKPKRKTQRTRQA